MSAFNSIITKKYISGDRLDLVAFFFCWIVGGWNNSLRGCLQDDNELTAQYSSSVYNI